MINNQPLDQFRQSDNEIVRLSKFNDRIDDCFVISFFIKYFLLLRQYQEEMLSAYFTESDEFPELLHYCNVMYETLLLILKGVYDLRIDKDARRLAAIAIVAGGYGGDMPEDQCYDLLDDMDFYYNKVKCKKIERMLPQLSKMVITESSHLI